MRNKALNLTTYTFTKGESLLLDANIWLCLFPAPSGSPSYVTAKYSSALKNMIQTGAQLVLDALILSEYLNCYCRIEYKATAPQGVTFKQYRNSPAFLPVGKTATGYAQNILGLCQRHNHPFASTDINQVLGNFEAGINDFNDGLLADACRQNGWKLVTHDGDFTEGGINVLTVNGKLLAACP